MVLNNKKICFSIILSWQPESKFPFSKVRLPPKDGPKPEFQEHQEIEVFSRANDQEASGWWRAIINVSIILLALFINKYKNDVIIFRYSSFKLMRESILCNSKISQTTYFKIDDNIYNNSIMRTFLINIETYYQLSILMSRGSIKFFLL